MSEHQNEQSAPDPARTPTKGSALREPRVGESLISAFIQTVEGDGANPSDVLVVEQIIGGMPDHKGLLLLDPQSVPMALETIRNTYADYMATEAASDEEQPHTDVK